MRRIPEQILSRIDSHNIDSREIKIITGRGIKIIRLTRLAQSTDLFC